MNYSLSQKNIVDQFGEYDGRLSVVAFDLATNQRIITYAGLNPIGALRELAFYSHPDRTSKNWPSGTVAYIIRDIDDLPRGTATLWDRDEFLAAAEGHFFDPGFWYGRTEYSEKKKINRPK